MIPLPGKPAATTPPSSPAPVARNTEIATAAWEVPLEPIGQPVVADGVALVYAKTATGVNAHAFSVADGKQLWTQPVHPGYEAPSVPLEPVITRTASGRSTAIFLQAATAPAGLESDEAWWTAPVAFDLSTGKELYRGQPEVVSTRPFACDGLLDLCFVAYDQESQSIEHWVDIDSGEETGGADVNPLTGVFRPIGKELYSVVEDGVEKLAHVSFGEVLWEVETEKIFGKGASADFGGRFIYSEKLDLFVGSMWINPTNVSPDKFAEQTFTMNLRETAKTVGFRASSGRVLWTADGSTLDCSQTMGTEATTLEDGDSFPLRCEFTEGHIEFPSGKYRSAKSKLVGYYPLTGDVSWETEPVDVGWSTRELIPTAGHGDHAIAGVPRSQNLLDTRTGKFRGTSFEDVFICLEQAMYPMPPGGPYKDVSGSGSFWAFPCMKSGSAVPALTYGALMDVSTADQDTAVISFEGKVAGYKLLKDFV
ncbi:PQQ-like beta-propeller repeat protein [Paenarthrobacter aurescens]|uniref:PQQ-like beta-propeller repeat protein n=1 Tax=Paenarthrobacter aurescens TaxID=43663 RepID=UPI001FE36FD6|nr:PQQ-like beta-propeller repeat protein [Paenarthrobacter aurescens]MDO6144596.1 PQQ-like beta-propeller repeat protein [Paenarthrobacter aurescens]MDO6148441.1 PQQ-like beta-propeller repeat protein [Paenarthrobacter aurescens]MDO6159687.1 PQQ-like beta-propeller repeat protein [Paenarthrobacter aurescens]MDO6164589.1 PQQ-like beta-propeller repeat protein [Paenarthrobacter aurescens]